MFIKIQPQSTNGGALHFIEYLEKQNENKEKNQLLNYLDKQNSHLGVNNTEGREYFFSSKKEKVSKIEVLDALERNHGGLKANEAKFYTLIISPSQSEIKHLEKMYGGKSKEALKEYTKDIMRGYSVCMNREIGGRPLREDDLVWYGMYENERTFGRRDWEVIHNREYFKLDKLIKSGGASEEEKKEFETKNGFYVLNAKGEIEKRTQLSQGDKVIREKVQKIAEVGQGHIHVVVHRKDKSGKLSLSPLANSRGKAQIKNIYYSQGKRITKVKAQELSKSQGKSLEEVVEVRSEKRMIGFDRTYFKHYAESAFDHKFDYERKEGERFENYNQKAKQREEFFEKYKGDLIQKKEVFFDLSKRKESISSDLKLKVIEESISLIEENPKEKPKKELELSFFKEIKKKDEENIRVPNEGNKKQGEESVKIEGLKQKEGEALGKIVEFKKENTSDEIKARELNKKEGVYFVFEKQKEQLKQKSYKKKRGNIRNEKINLLRREQIDLIRKGAKVLEGQLKGELKKEVGLGAYKEVEGIYRETMKISTAIFKPTESFTKLSPQSLAAKLVSKGVNMGIKSALDLIKVRGIEF